MLKKIKIFEEQLIQINDDFRAQNDRNVEWQNQFLSKYEQNEKKLLDEINTIRKKNSSNEMQMRQTEQEIRHLQNQE